jgi:hypothetical protein
MDAAGATVSVDAQIEVGIDELAHVQGDLAEDREVVPAWFVVASRDEFSVETSFDRVPIFAEQVWHDLGLAELDENEKAIWVTLVNDGVGTSAHAAELVALCGGVVLGFFDGGHVEIEAMGV